MPLTEIVHDSDEIVTKQYRQSDAANDRMPEIKAISVSIGLSFLVARPLQYYFSDVA